MKKISQIKKELKQIEKKALSDNRGKENFYNMVIEQYMALINEYYNNNNFSYNTMYSLYLWMKNKSSFDSLICIFLGISGCVLYDMLKYLATINLNIQSSELNTKDTIVLILIIIFLVCVSLFGFLIILKCVISISDMMRNDLTQTLSEKHANYIMERMDTIKNSIPALEDANAKIKKEIKKSQVSENNQISVKEYMKKYSILFSRFEFVKNIINIIQSFFSWLFVINGYKIKRMIYINELEELCEEAKCINLKVFKDKEIQDIISTGIDYKINSCKIRKNKINKQLRNTGKKICKRNHIKKTGMKN